MELIYLWVDEYKNIKSQGFNFSPRFDCQYNQSTGKLTITENKTYKSIFPENINITAIVGENGSGKSSTLVGLSNHSLIFKIDDKYYCRGFKTKYVKQSASYLKALDIAKSPFEFKLPKELNTIKLDSYFEIEEKFDIKNIKAPFKIEEEKEIKDILEHTIYLDFDLIKINTIGGFSKYFRRYIYQRNLYHKMRGSMDNDINFNISNFRERFFNLILEHHKRFNSNIFIYKPKTIILSDYINTNSNKDTKWEKINKLIKEVQSSNFSKEKFLIWIYSNLATQVELFKELPLIESIDDILINEEILLSHTPSIGFEKINKENIYKFFESLNSQEVISFEEFDEIYKTHKESFLQLQNLCYINIDFEDEKDRKFFSLSQGERKFFTESLMIFDAVHKNENDDILLVLNEPDITMHPDWQKKYINEILKLLSDSFPDKRFQIVITSHSPFVLSDIPKEHVILLEKDKNGNCKNVSNSIELKQTFGANIHTLLSHGFFMNDGLMGEFAKSKINEIKVFYDENKDLEKDIQNFIIKKEEYIKKKDDFHHIKSIIGEPFLQTIIKNYLDELEILFYGKKDFLDKEIKRLQELQEDLDD